MPDHRQDAQKGCPARPQRVKNRDVPTALRGAVRPYNGVWMDKPLQHFSLENLNRYVEDLNDARTPLADFFSILLSFSNRFFAELRSLTVQTPPPKLLTRPFNVLLDDCGPMQPGPVSTVVVGTGPSLVSHTMRILERSMYSTAPVIRS